MVTEIVDLDLGSNSSFKIITMEGDIRSRFIEFHLSYNGEVFNLQNKSVKCRYVNGRTTEEVNLVINDRVNGVCTLEIPYRITSSAQNRKCELVISQSGELLSTIPFVVEVVNSLVERATVESSNEFGALTNALWKIDRVNAELNNITDSVIYKRIYDFSKLIFKGCKVKLIGDSITAGQGGTNFNSNFNTSGGELITDKIWKKSWYTNDTGTCWANSLKDYLTQKFGCTVKNYGCPGIGVDQMLLAIDDLVRDEDELVICMIGTNNRHNMQLNEFYSKLKQIYDIITITKKKKCIMMSCMPASVKNELSNNRIFHAEDIDNMYFKLSCEKNIEYISVYKEVLKYCDTKGINVDTLLTSDGLHPNDTGYNVMFMIICMALGFAPKRDSATW